MPTRPNTLALLLSRLLLAVLITAGIIILLLARSSPPRGEGSDKRISGTIRLSREE